VFFVTSEGQMLNSRKDTGLGGRRGRRGRNTWIILLPVFRAE